MIGQGTCISEVAFACGYQSVSGFSMAFARHVGCPPSLLRPKATTQRPCRTLIVKGACGFDCRRGLVRSEGLEPPRCYSLPPQGSASTSSATSANVGRPLLRGRINGADVTNRPLGDKSCRLPKFTVFTPAFCLLSACQAISAASA